MEIGSTGLDFFPVKTGFLDSDEFFCLTDGDTTTEAYALVGRYLTLHAYIVGRGPVLVVKRITLRRIAKMLGLDLDGVQTFIARCCESGLFHEGLWEHEGILTSEAIQSDWVRGKKKGAQREKWSQWSLLDGRELTYESEDNETYPDILGYVSKNEGESDSYPVISDSNQNISGYVSQKETESDSYPVISETYPDILPTKKIREDKRKEDEREIRPESVYQIETGEVFDNDVENSPSEGQKADSPIAPDAPCACLAQEIEGKAYADGEGKPHRTAYGALAARYQQRTQRKDFAALMAKVCDLCPASCRASPDDVSQCHALIAGALDKYDPSRGSPWAIVRRVLTEDRG